MINWIIVQNALPRYQSITTCNVLRGGAAISRGTCPSAWAPPASRPAPGAGTGRTLLNRIVQLYYLWFPSRMCLSISYWAPPLQIQALGRTLLNRHEKYIFLFLKTLWSYGSYHSLSLTCLYFSLPFFFFLSFCMEAVAPDVGTGRTILNRILYNY